MSKIKLVELAGKELTLNKIITGYHYSKMDLGNDTILEPKKSFKNKNLFSKNDYMLSTVPRVWYYVDLKKIEMSVKSNFLYKAKLDGHKIVNLPSALDMYYHDPNDLRINYVNTYTVLKKSHNSYNNIDYNKLMKNLIKYNFDGAYYETGGIPMIIMFVPVKVKKTKK